jgi:hypothetical protein
VWFLAVRRNRTRIPFARRLWRLTDPRRWLAGQLAAEDPRSSGASVADAFAALAQDRAAGGRGRADWPGLADGKLLEGRDLQPSLDLRALAKGLLASHLGLDHAAIARAFPGSETVSPAAGLIRM